MDKAVLDFYLHHCDDTNSLGHFKFKKKNVKNQPVSAPCWTNHEIGCFLFFFKRPKIYQGFIALKLYVAISSY